MQGAFNQSYSIEPEILSLEQNFIRSQYQTLDKSQRQLSGRGGTYAQSLFNGGRPQNTANSIIYNDEMNSSKFITFQGNKMQIPAGKHIDLQNRFNKSTTGMRPIGEENFIQKNVNQVNRFKQAFDKRKMHNQ